MRTIYELYISGESVIGIINRLNQSEIKTATGKDKWSKNTIIKMLSNEKYCGNVEIFKTCAFVTQDEYVRTKGRKRNVGENERYYIVDNHPAIISKDDFAAVQAEKSRRSNIEQTSEGVRRKSTKCSSKKKSG